MTDARGGVIPGQN